MNNLNKQQGFLLIEVVIVSLIISVTLVGIVSMYTQAAVSAATSGTYITAINLAQKRLEELKTEDAAFWKAVCNNGKIEGVKGYANHFVINNIYYHIASEAIDFSVQGEKEIVKLAQVTVRIEWDNQSKNDDKNYIELKSLYNKNP